MHSPGTLELPALLLAIGLAGFGFGRAASRGTGAAVAAAILVAFVVTGDTWLPLAVGAAGLASAVQSRRRGGSRTPWPVFVRDLTTVVGCLCIYMLARWAVAGTEEDALANASNVIRFEQAVHLWVEPDIQEAWRDHQLAVDSLGAFYSFGFLAFVAATLMWTWTNARDVFRLYRTALGVSAVLAVVIITLFPVAPPRLMPDSGIIDTIASLGRERVYANEFAAVPSLHVGWMALGGYASWRCMPRWWVACIASVPALLMALTVVVTGNHYWIDAVVGVGISLAPALLVSHWPRALQTVRIRLWRGLNVMSHSPRAQLTVLSLGGLFIYLLLARWLNPGFTDFWGYLVAQVAAILLLLLAGEVFLAGRGGLSWATATTAIICTYADVLGTDGNLYAGIDEYDKLTHFLGTAAIAAGLTDVLRAVGRGKAGPFASPRVRFVVAAAGGITFGIGWEVYEWLGDAVFGTARSQSQWDTLNDLVSDTAGAFAAAALAWRANVLPPALERRDRNRRRLVAIGTKPGVPPE